MGSRVKHRNKTINKMLAGKIPVEEARQRYGGKVARKGAAADLVKAQRAQLAKGSAGLDAALGTVEAAMAPRRPVTEADVIDAIRAPMAVPPAVKAEKSAGRDAPARREALPQALKAAGGMQAEAALLYAGRGVPPVSSWTPAQRELWRQAHEHHDPQVRANAWTSLDKELAGPGQPATSVQAIAWGAGPDGASGWQSAQQPPAPGLRIAPPGTAGR